jgi:ketosteroid isomerase-like protein
VTSVSRPDLEVIDRFFAAFSAHDGATMATCYQPDATFGDPVFPDLSGPEVGAMWRMLTSRADDLTVELVDRSAADGTGSASWVARYRFGQTGRPVVNAVESAYRFEDGLIADQRDTFDFARWARQALGLQGLALGRTGFLRRQVQQAARGRLDRFLEREG